MIESEMLNSQIHLFLMLESSAWISENNLNNLFVETNWSLMHCCWSNASRKGHKCSWWSTYFPMLLFHFPLSDPLSQCRVWRSPLVSTSCQAWALLIGFMGFRLAVVDPEERLSEWETVGLKEGIAAHQTAASKSAFTKLYFWSAMSY